MKVKEIEEIFAFLWEKQDNLFDNFFSKSTQKLDFSSDGRSINDTSKFLNFIEHFIDVFQKNYSSFYHNPKYKIIQKERYQNFNNQHLDKNSLNWILRNLDKLTFDTTLKNHPDSISIGSHHGYLNKIVSTDKIQSLDIYENQIILGSFAILLDRLNRLKKEITSNIGGVKTNLSNDIVDFKDLKKIPFIRLFNDSQSLENRLKKLYSKYLFIFKDVNINRTKPKLTQIFASYNHYQNVFKVIKILNYYKFNLDGYFRLLNITKLSKLYEIYNLHKIVGIIEESLPTSFNKLTTTIGPKDGFLDKFVFMNQSGKKSVSIYYEIKYWNHVTDEINLVRIDNAKGNYFCPDYVVKIKNDINYKYLILDAKYSRYQTVKNKHLNDCIQKYIVKTGIFGEPYRKVDSLTLLAPIKSQHDLIDNEDFRPSINIIPSKPFNEKYLESFLKRYLKV